jgi:hypothetical protein
MAGYQVTYRVANSASGQTQGGWEVLTVRRPFDGADLQYDRKPGPGVVASGGSAADQHVLYAFDSGRFQQVAARQPGPPPGDQYLLQEMPDLTKRGLAQDSGRSLVVAGRQCEVYDFFEPPAGPVKALSGPANRDEVCLDSNGLELSERWTYNGHLVLVRTATEVRTSAFRVPSTAGASESKLGSAAPRGFSDPKPQSFLVAPPAPDGFRATTPVRYLFPDPQSPSQLLAASVVWAFVDGNQVITVEAGQEAPGQLPWQNGDTVTTGVHLAGLGPASTALRSDGPEVRVALARGWVRVRGTVPLSALVDYAGKLRLSAQALTGG